MPTCSETLCASKKKEILLMTEPSLESPLIAGLDLTSIDDQIIPFARSLSRFLPHPRLRFVHVVQRYDLDVGPEEDPASVARRLDHALRPELTQKIRRYLPRFAPEDLLLPHAEEDAAKDLVETAASTCAGLLVIGEKEGNDRSHWYSRRITTTAPCPVAVFPDKSEIPAESRSDARGSAGWKTVLFAGDFSRAADPALAFALGAARENGLRLGMHLVQDASGSFFPFFRHRKGRSSAEATRRAAEKSLDRLALTADRIDFVTELDEDPHENEAERLLAAAMAYEADLIVVGTRGKTDRATDPCGHLIECLGRIRKRRPILYFGERANPTPSLPATDG
jgi:nucleotide-binding universal stress UspA family protein